MKKWSALCQSRERDGSSSPAFVEKGYIRAKPSFVQKQLGDVAQRRGSREQSSIGYLDHPFEKEDPWAFTTRIFLVVKWGLAIEIAGEEFSYTR